MHAVGLATASPPTPTSSLGALKITRTADFCLVPMGVEVSVSKYIAECQRVLEKSGLKYEASLVSLAPTVSEGSQLHGYGTGLEGEYGEVMKVIEQCHEAIHAMGCPRIATDIRIGTRTDKKGSLAAKVSSVKNILQYAQVLFNFALDDSALDDSASRPSSRRPSASGGPRSSAPTGLSMPTPLGEKPDPQIELARRMSETRQYLASPMYDPVAGRDA
ncbi:hypothetical protein RHOSPDRAFT_31930 [Rhodotorula sp. JG-1b]|nr:hypothetical protein RHOSPDRAFT_31930 [Rhodotorula sp. JG-1b]